ncbi:DUF7351 domain-containing protein [Halovivax cerinus]|uniref:ArsR family transcriptional regulator n=1 Tax=Halovivax cerinus TaxID=1487865 RepID=A0ABD5NS07_9EURY|nr:ArsR family transcriptional regulator [Halovivax cerinus]
MDDETRLTYGSLPPEAALSLLGNDVRTTILWTLSEARGGDGPPPILPFSTLKERTGLDIDSSRFNYHLQELTGTFVERVDPDTRDDAQLVSGMAGPKTDGFRLRPEGTTLIRTVRAWSIDGDGSRARVELDQECHHCDGTLIGRYENAIFAVQCDDCDYLYDYNLTPPGIVAASDGRLDRVAAFNRQQRRAFASGICPLCAGPLDSEFQEPAETGYPRSDLRSVLIRRGCAHCGNKDNLTVGEFLCADAGLIAFCHERGLDVTTTPLWELPFAATDRAVTVETTDPWTVTLQIDLAGDRLVLGVDESLAVVKRRRA